MFSNSSKTSASSAETTKTEKNPQLALRWLSLFFSAFSFAIVLHSLFSPDAKETLSSQAIYWFSISFIAAIIPWAKEFELGSLKITLQEFKDELKSIKKEIKEISESRYANLVYLLDSQGNLAIIQRPQYDNRWIPCGTRLEPNEFPHEAVERIISEELGLARRSYDFWPKFSEVTYEETRMVPKPYQVQIESSEHLRGKGGEAISQHYDFVYVCTTFDEMPSLREKYVVQWISFRKFKREIALAQKRGESFTFHDVEITYERILRDMGKLDLL